MTKLMKLIRDENGATAIEYGLIAALIAVAGITAFSAVGTSISRTFNGASTKMNAGATAGGV